MNKSTAWILIMIAWITVFAGNSSAQNSRQKVGVALSGGGARGFAHIGVLQWFEEHRIPVYYVAGTSMGALVGGLYATGRSPAEIKQVVENIDWIELLRPVPPYETLSFRRKEDRREFANYLEFGLKRGFRLPAGLNSGHSIGLLLNRLTLPYSTIKNFDELPIPFRCLATDMLEAKQVTLSDGPLPVALQATMAIPGVFMPIEMDGQILASDGGVINNIPTDAVEEMNPDVIIAIDIGTPLGDREALQTLTGVLNQSISVMMEQSSRRSLDQSLHPKLEVVLKPELKKFTTFDFAAGQEIMKLGYDGAEARKSELLRYAVSEEEWNEYLRQRQSRVKKEIAIPDFLEVQGATKEDEQILRKELTPKLSEFSPDVIEHTLNKAWGTGLYSRVTYWEFEQDGKTGLQVLATQKSYAPPFLNLGLELNNTQTDTFDFNMRARATFFDVFAHNSELRLDGVLGSRILIGAEYYKRFGTTRAFVAPNASFEHTKTGLFVDEDQVAEYSINRGLLGVDLGYEFNSLSEVRLGYTIGNVDASVSIGDPILPDISGKNSHVQLQWIFDDSNSAMIPTRGVRLLSQLRYVLDTPVPENSNFDTEFPQFNTRAAAFLPYGKKNTFFVLGEGATSFDSTAAPAEQYTMGGLFRVSSLSRDEFRGNHDLMFGVGYLRKIGELPPLIGEKILLGAWVETGSAFNDWDEKDFSQSISVGLIVETLLGPIFVGGSFGDDGRANFHFALGRFF